METPKATGATVPSQVSPELLEPLVTVVATLGDLGTTVESVPLAGSPGSLRAGLVALIATIRQAMGHRHGEAARLRYALATARAPTGATAEPAAVPRAARGEAWATAAAVTREWREVVASVAATWATLEKDAARLRDACRTVATVGATAGVTRGDLEMAEARQGEALQELRVATRALPVTTEVATMAEVVAAHEERVAKASTGLQAATEATEATAVALVEAAVARERGQRAAVAIEPLGRLVAACHGATDFYRHLQHRLEVIEATMAAMAAGHGGPEVAQDGPGVTRATMSLQGGPGVPEDLMAAVTAAEALWDASARLARCHLLGALRVARDLLFTPSVPSATALAQRCQDATAALPGLLSQGPR